MVDYNYKCPKCGTRPGVIYDEPGNPLNNKISFYCGNIKCNVDEVKVSFMS